MHSSYPVMTITGNFWNSLRKWEVASTQLIDEHHRWSVDLSPDCYESTCEAMRRPSMQRLNSPIGGASLLRDITALQYFCHAVSMSTRSHRFQVTCQASHSHGRRVLMSTALHRGWPCASRRLIWFESISDNGALSRRQYPSWRQSLYRSVPVSTASHKSNFILITVWS